MDSVAFEMYNVRIWHNIAYERFYGMDYIRTTDDLDVLGMVYRVLEYPTHDAHSSPEYFETEQLVERVLWVREQLIDVAGRLPLTPDGEVTPHENVRVLLLSDYGEQSFSYNVFPLAFFNARTPDERHLITTNFTTSINFRHIQEHIQDASLHMFLVQEHEGSERYIFQGIITTYGEEITFTPAVTNAE